MSDINSSEWRIKNTAAVFYDYEIITSGVLMLVIKDTSSIDTLEKSSTIKKTSILLQATSGPEQSSGTESKTGVILCTVNYKDPSDSFDGISQINNEYFFEIEYKINGVSKKGILFICSNDNEFKDSKKTNWTAVPSDEYYSTITTVNSDPPSSQDTSNGMYYGDNNDEEESTGYLPDIASLNLGQGNSFITNTEISTSEFININHVAGVFGLPYQFLPYADTRLTDSSGFNDAMVAGALNSSSLGYEYANKIIEKIPLLLISPGRANFMSKYSKKDKTNIINKVISTVTGSDSGFNEASLDDLTEKSGRYYTFEYDTTGYYKFVNPMCRIAAIYLGIGDEILPGASLPLKSVNWGDYTRSGITSIGDFGTYTSIPFYIESETSVSDSFSNSTSQSLLSSTVNSYSDMSRELSFLLGTSASTLNLDSLLNDVDIVNSVENLTDLANRLLGHGNIFNKLSQHLKTVVSGGKLLFPEIWSDSSYSKSYSCEFKFVSPDPSKLSIYLNILVPYFHLLGLVAPQSTSDNPNGYGAPFLVRAMYKGFFNVDMGIITDMSVTKGAECQWTKDGIPTSMNVQITIKDLYQAMSITSSSASDWSYDSVSNTALMDYIANLCGVNIYKPEIGRAIDIWLTNKSNKLIDFGTNIWGSIEDKIQNTIMNIYRK